MLVPEERPGEGLLVIGAGWGRTGTDSLRQALNMLGFGPTMHMYEIMQAHPFALIWQWLKIGAARSPERRVKLLREALRGYRSAIDGPSFVYYKELMEMFPEAKVVLTVRSSAREWYDSAVETIFLHTTGAWTELSLHSIGLYLYQRLHPIGWLFQQMLVATMADITPLPQNRTDTEHRYDAWIQRVRSEVPAGKLLILNPSDGWDPLCRFLNASVPSEPYPRQNSKAQFQNVLNHESRVGWVTLVVYLIMVWWIVRLHRTVFRES